MEELNLKEIFSQEMIAQFMEFMPSLLLAIVTLLVGFYLSGLLVRQFIKGMNKKGVDRSLQTFIGSSLSILLKVAVLISVCGIIGIQTTSFLALLGSAGLAIGLALQGSLSNFAGGIIILLTKPFRVNDVITAQGETGTVEEVSVLQTILKTFDNKTIIIPNGKLANDKIVNVTRQPHRRVDFVMGVSYGDDLKKAKDVIHQVLSADERVLKDKDIFIGITELASSSVNISARVWVNTPDYWGTFTDNLEKLKIAFDRENISIPFPQLRIHQDNISDR